MGKKREVRNWTEEEEEALGGGVAKHGPAEWTKIDPKFGPLLLNRSNTAPKDKWCKLVTHDSKEKLKRPDTARKKTTSQAATAPGSSAATTQTSGGPSNVAMEEEPSTGSQDAKKPPRNKLQPSAVGHMRKMEKKSIQNKSPEKRDKTRSLPSSVGTVRRSQRIMLSRFKALPSNQDDPIVID